MEKLLSDTTRLQFEENTALADSIVIIVVIRNTISSLPRSRSSDPAALLALRSISGSARGVPFASYSEAQRI